MATLQEILGAIIDSAGTQLNLPEMNLSEKIAGGNTQNTLNYQYAQGNNPYSWHAPSFTPNSTNSVEGVTRTWNTINPDNTLKPITNGKMTEQQALDSGKDVNELRKQGLLAEPSGGGGGDQADLARRALESRLNSIKNAMALIKGEGERLRGIASQQTENLKKTIGDRYGGLRTEAKTNLDNILASLSEADTGTVKDYAQSQGSLNKSAEGTTAQNRALARALGYGNSSYYMNMQDKARNNLVDKTSSLTAERSGKLANIKRDVSGANTWFNQKNTDLGNEEASLKSNADLAYQDQVGKMLFNEQNYGIDNVDAAAQAQIDYESKLNNISKYLSNVGNYAKAYNSVADTTSTGIKNTGTEYADKLANTLGQTSALQASASPGFSPIQGSSGYSNDSNTRALIDKYKKKNSYQDYVYPTVGTSIYA